MDADVRGSVTTFADCPTDLRIVVVAGDLGRPCEVKGSQRTCRADGFDFALCTLHFALFTVSHAAIAYWSVCKCQIWCGSVWLCTTGEVGVGRQQLCELVTAPYTGPHMFLRMGGQVRLRDAFVAALSAVRDREKLEMVSFQVRRIALGRQQRCFLLGM